MTEATTSRPRVSGLSGAFTSWFDPAAWFLYADVLLALTAAMLPWSTTGFAVLLGIWFVSLIPRIPTVEVRALLRLLSRPICALPLAIFALAVVGTLWAEIPWKDRLQGISPVVKLLVVPILLYHFERSGRGSWVFLAFVASCGLLMVFSWIVFYVPELKLEATKNAGVPVKNYIDQSQEFSLSMVALAPFVISLYRQRRFVAAAACAGLALGFFANMAFVVSARAALIYVPVLLAVFAIMHLDRSKAALLFAGLILAATAIWFTSPYLRGRITDISVEYESYQQNVALSTGRRIMYWQRSLGFFAEAPVFGHGTGSIKHLFEQTAAGQSGLAGEVTRNPHNQTLNFAVQWGVCGIALLYGIWLTHLWLFRGGGPVNWIGLLVVVQNVVSSLLNSHLSDFHEGWMYVLGVGVAGGMSLAARRRESAGQPISAAAAV